MPYTYSTDILVEPPVLFGRRLLPLCLGHVRVLHALEHPALTSDGLSAADLGSAVWVCSTDWKKAGHKIRSGRFARELVRLGRKARKVETLPAIHEAFDEYREFYIAAPPRLHAGKAEEERVPWFITLFIAVQKNTNLSADETWALTPREAA